jgi:outer membrane immunogenic protein
MKKLLIIASLLFVTHLSFGQYALSKGQAQLNAGLGFSSWGLPVYLGFDAGVHPDISVGGELSFRSYNDRWAGNRYKHNIIGISANGNYHFNSLLDIPEEWDFYAGLNLGFYIWSTNDDDYKGDGSSGLGLGAQVGGRYYFNDRFGVNLEVGGGNAFGGGKFGITLKL